jgi:putative ABC transport system permease protein
VAGLVSEYVGVAGYMDLSALNRLLREGHAISGAYLATDPATTESLFRTEGNARVAGTSVRTKVLENFYETMAKQVLTFAFFNTLLAGTIAFGVVYNSARIALSERSRSWQACGSWDSPAARFPTSCLESWEYDARCPSCWFPDWKGSAPT